MLMDCTLIVMEIEVWRIPGCMVRTESGEGEGDVESVWIYGGSQIGQEYVPRREKAGDELSVW